MNWQKGIAFQISSLQQTGGLQWRWSFIRGSVTQATAQPVLQACCTNCYGNSTVLNNNNLLALRQLRLQHTKRKSASVSEFCLTYEYTPFVASDFIKMIIFHHFINVNFLHIFTDLTFFFFPKHTITVAYHSQRQNTTHSNTKIIKYR